MRDAVALAVLFAALVVASAARAEDPILAPMMRPGRTVDASAFTHRRSVHLYPSAAGVSRYPLAPADLAVARPRFGDIRIVDPDGRQASYVVEHGRRERMPVSIERTDSASTYAIELPHAPLTVVAIEIEVAERYIDRPYRLVADHDGDRELVSAGMLERHGKHLTPLPLLMSGETRADSFTLTIDDGDDAPLGVTGAKITIATADLYVVAPPGAYTMLMGNDDLRSPRYELQSVRHHLATAPAGEAQVGPLEENPDHHPILEEEPPKEKDQAVLLWGAIGLSVLILGALTLRVARTP